MEHLNRRKEDTENVVSKDTCQVCFMNIDKRLNKIENIGTLIIIF
jgi:hypothetical protein